MSSVPGHHSAYRREALLALDDELDASLVAGEPLLAKLRSAVIVSCSSRKLS
jgi:hypothetical protein